MGKKHYPSADTAELRGRAEERLKERQRSKKREEVVTWTGGAERLIQELQIHQVELEMQNEELQKSRIEVEGLLDQYTDLYDLAPVGYFTLDRDGKIRRLNLNGASMLGEERLRLVNRLLGFYVSEADRPAFNEFLQKVFTNRADISNKATCEVTLCQQQDRTTATASEAQMQGVIGGPIRQVLIEAQVTEDGQECRSVMMDITKRKQAEEALQRIHAALERNMKGALDVLSETIERKGPYAIGHHRRVAALASAIAREMRLPEFQAKGIELAAAVYDIGLMTIPLEFLQDRDQLDGIKLMMYQGYPQAGHDALKKIESPWPIAEIILQHRECFDGSGFPQGLKKANILIEARVLAVADAVEDLTTHRSYRNAFSLDQALESISPHNGSKYDPEVVAGCLRLFKEKGYKMKG